tara:strand:- start:208539 stop:209117 length:579 start_codon:yes stop_codon:yes gene_type:complete
VGSEKIGAIREYANRTSLPKESDQMKAYFPSLRSREEPPIGCDGFLQKHPSFNGIEPWLIMYPLRVRVSMFRKDTGAFSHSLVDLTKKQNPNCKDEDWSIFHNTGSLDAMLQAEESGAGGGSRTRLSSLGSSHTTDVLRPQRFERWQPSQKMVPGAGVEPALPKESDFESDASANSATRASRRVESCVSFMP